MAEGNSNRIIVLKIVGALTLLYMLWLMVCCPCRRLLCCHLGRFWIAMAILLGIVFMENGFKLIDPSCV